MSLPPRIERLAALAGKAERRMLGLMSGTSLDGLDMALCRIAGHGTDTELTLLHFKTDPYGTEERERLRALASRETVSLRDLTVAHAWLAERHASAVLAALGTWGVAPGEVDAIASHGQTLYHAPGGWELEGAARHATLQIGDGDHLALRTGILTVSDFRQKEIAGGGEGAPLAPYAEALLFGGAARPRVLLNLGGIANFTWLPAQGDAHAPVSGDSGPGNTLLDLAVRRYFPDRAEGYDRDGAIAARGTPHAGLLAALKAHPYFGKPFPKSTGPETFGEAYLDAALEEAGASGAAPPAPEDVLATLTALSAETVAETLRRETPALQGAEAFLSGGGKHNLALVARLEEALPELAWRDVEALGIPGDAKEAVLFAVLANETLCGEGFPARAGTAPGTIGFGKISFPD
jgi:anhydro-N-acetylmuramic acid kinase